MSMVRDRTAELAALVCALLLATACTAPTSPGESASPSAAAPSASVTTTSPWELPTGTAQGLSAGNYELAQFPVGITFEIPTFEAPATWFECSESAVEQAVCYVSTPDSGVVVTFQIVENVVVDPCSDQETAELVDPPVGPSVDDLVTAISNLEGYEATAPVDITVDGFEGKEFTLTAPVTEGCSATWATADRTTGMGPGEINLLQVLDVDGVRVLINGAYGPETTEADMAAIQHVMDSTQIEP